MKLDCRFGTTLALCILLAAPVLATEGEIVSAAGAVEMSVDGRSWRPAPAGATVPAGGWIRTGDGARAELRMGRRTMRLYPDSVLRLTTGDENAAVEAGGTVFDVEPGSGPFRVRARDVVVSVKGTRFVVGIDMDRPSVLVSEGQVTIAAPGRSQPLRLGAGFAARADAAGSLELFAHRQEDPWSTWSAGGSLELGDPPMLPSLREELHRETNRRSDRERDAGSTLGDHDRDLDPVLDTGGATVANQPGPASAGGGSGGGPTTETLLGLPSSGGPGAPGVGGSISQGSDDDSGGSDDDSGGSDDD